MSQVPDQVRYARVALPIPLGQVFTYKLPSDQAIRTGSRVLVELGRRKILGIVLETDAPAPTDFDEKKIKPILSCLDQEPTLPDELRTFLQELARYYIAPIGEVFRLALPALERATADELQALAGKKLKAVGRMVQAVRLTEPGADQSALLPKGKSGELVEHLRQNGELELSALSEKFSTARTIVKKLAALGFVEVVQKEKESDPFFATPQERDTPPQLNEAQARAVLSLTEALDEKKGAQFLLDGVTASGKTEVYLHAAAHTLSQGRGVILLVPEIALTPQLVHRFRARLGDAIAVMHSGLTETARLWMWRQLRKGELKVVVGARSALFAPVQNLGLICVDEEHDNSYKQEEGVRYNARDMALLRAHRAGAVCVAGSATPSLSSEALVMKGKATRLVLPGRAHHTAHLPEVELLDLTRFGPGPSNDPLLSLPLHRALEETLAAGDQSILFLNRRGFAPSLVCGGCGTIAECPHCSVALTLHRDRSPRLECHYCDYQTRIYEKCPACYGITLTEEGTGTERIEALLATHFPTARIARMDRDVASGTKSEAIVERMRARQIDILVGTQMVTKGHDLPGVTLVGVLNADAALSLPDFRAAERTFHQLVQVAGRAGRADKPGRVLIQTRNPTHPAIVCAQGHDVRGFIRHELEMRRELNYPPFAHIALVRLDGVDEKEVAHEARRIAAIAEKHQDIELLGPAPAPLARLRNRYRFRFMLRSHTRGALRSALLDVARASISRKIRLGIDVDPQSML